MNFKRRSSGETVPTTLGLQDISSIRKSYKFAEFQFFQDPASNFRPTNLPKFDNLLQYGAEDLQEDDYKSCKVIYILPFAAAILDCCRIQGTVCYKFILFYAGSGERVRRPLFRGRGAQILAPEERDDACFSQIGSKIRPTLADFCCVVGCWWIQQREKANSISTHSEQESFLLAQEHGNPSSPSPVIMTLENDTMDRPIHAVLGQYSVPICPSTSNSCLDYAQACYALLAHPILTHQLPSLFFFLQVFMLLDHQADARFILEATSSSPGLFFPFAGIC